MITQLCIDCSDCTYSCLQFFSFLLWKMEY